MSDEQQPQQTKEEEQPQSNNQQEENSASNQSNTEQEQEAQSQAETIPDTQADTIDFNPQQQQDDQQDLTIKDQQLQQSETESQTTANKKRKKKNKKKKKPKSNNFMGEDNPDTDTGSRPQSDLINDEDGDSDDFTPLKDKLDDTFFEDQDSSEDEGMPDYKIGGYHPVHVGEILMDRYIIIQKLGWGHFSTVWLTKDLKYNNYVAIKVQKSAQHYLEAAYDEVEILDKVASNWRSKEWHQSTKEHYKDDKELLASLKKYGMTGDTSHCVQLLNSFIHHGPNGKHFIMVFEILGVNFLEIIKRYDYKGVPIPLVRKLARQCLIGLDYMHRMCRIIHTDFKPENVVIGLRDDEVEEIYKTGQLTSTKMFNKNEHIKILNMKVAGTFVKSNKNNSKKQENDDINDTSSLLDENSSMANMTAKQKQNRRKKLQKKRKKLEKSRVESNMESSMTADDQDEVLRVDDLDDNGDLPNLDDIDVGLDKPKADSNKKQEPEKKKHSKTDSINLVNDNFTGLLNEDQENADNQAVNSLQEDDEAMKPKRGPRINEDVQVKICDMGNGCWTYHHFTPEIQTRQYRSPEVIIGADYNTSADIWSFACTIFEMVTGDFLFEPRKAQNYDKDDDHLAQMMELLGRMPANLALSGKHSRKFFDSRGHLRRINGLGYWPLKKVLMEKYRIKEPEALALQDFLLPMLNWHHDRRATAQEMLKHPWLNMESNYDYKYTDKEYDIMKLKMQVKGGRNDANDDEKQEMNELVDSDPEIYAPDAELEASDDLDDHSDDEGADAWDFFDDGDSLMDSDEGQERLKSRKAKDAKINNSYTGPYPLDPTDFGHADKGPNAQFMHVLAELQQTNNDQS